MSVNLSYSPLSLLCRIKNHSLNSTRTEAVPYLGLSLSLFSAVFCSCSQLMTVGTLEVHIVLKSIMSLYNVIKLSILLLNSISISNFFFFPFWLLLSTDCKFSHFHIVVECNIEQTTFWKLPENYRVFPERLVQFTFNPVVDFKLIL